MSFTKIKDFTGRYGINLGQSIINAWNEGNNMPAGRGRNDSRIEFHLIRSSFQPMPVDNEAPGIPRPIHGEKHSRHGLGRPGTNRSTHNAVRQRNSGDWECVLLWDTRTRTFTLEKLDSTRNVTLEGSSSKISKHGKERAARKGKGMATTAFQRVDTPVVNQRQDQWKLEEGEIDEFAEALTKELEVDVGEEKENVDFKRMSIDSSSGIRGDSMQKTHTPLPVQRKTKAKASPKPQTSTPGNKISVSSAETTVTNRQTPKAVGIAQDQRGMVPIQHHEEEELTFGQPSRPIARRNSLSEPHPLLDSRLELPQLPSPTRSTLNSRPIASQGSRLPSIAQNDAVEEGSVVEDVNEDLFANEIDVVLEEDDEEEDEDEKLEPAPAPNQGVTPTTLGRPLSLAELARINNDTDSISDDDDDTSSESSD